ncbi:hypothetical protein NLI96_g11787 [Meripilus lineatus]|uniref:Uncharacterized protein n=1 Tax=Meripilus lineatus TaxID=2056292 RepID=A0AAD5YD05_9APHY|nr:hypothetical protein NLI96_g11787 [Physisporinus lineatus]
MEILSAEFVKKGTARSLSLQNRSQRLLEYAERRTALSCSAASSVARRKRRLSSVSSLDEEETGIPSAPVEDEEFDLCASRTLVFGSCVGWTNVGYKYSPGALKNVLFPEDSSDEHLNKRRRVSPPDTNTMDVDEPAQSSTGANSSSPTETKPQRSVIVETVSETFLISPQTESGSSEEEKDNAGDGEAVSPRSGGRRYMIALLPRKQSNSARTSESEATSSSGDQQIQASSQPAEPSVPAPIPAKDDDPKTSDSTLPPTDSVMTKSSPTAATPSIPISKDTKLPALDVEMVDAKRNESLDDRPPTSASTEEGEIKEDEEQVPMSVSVGEGAVGGSSGTESKNKTKAEIETSVLPQRASPPREVVPLAQADVASSRVEKDRTPPPPVGGPSSSPTSSALGSVKDDKGKIKVKKED